jgi:hypothetical protein
MPVRPELGDRTLIAGTHLAGQVQIVFHAGIFGHMLDEISKHPSEEEGGKYIGHLFEPGRLSIEGVDNKKGCHTLLITDFLPSGPKAVRTAVEFLPDGEYQEALFRKLEAQDPDIEHLGSWHTHHCNGLRTLSHGDVRGYFRTVNKTAYRPKFFLASLITRIPSDPKEAGWIDHFLFLKGSDEYYNVSDLVRILDLATRADTKPRLSVRKKSSSTEAASPTPKRVWYNSQTGRHILAEDKAFFSVHFGDTVVSTLRGDQMTTTGHQGDKTMSVTYPETEGDDTLRVLVRKDRTNLVQISSQLARRQLAFVGALAVLEAVSKRFESSTFLTE